MDMGAMLAGKRVLVTGASSGLGENFARLAAGCKAKVVIAARRKDMITCTIEGNPDGTTAVDYTVNSATGYPYVTGNADAKTPVNHVLPAWDLACAMQGAFAVLAAYMRRQATGEGAEIRISLADIAFSTLSHLGVLADAELFDQERPAIGNSASAERKAGERFSTWPVSSFWPRELWPFLTAPACLLSLKAA